MKETIQGTENKEEVVLHGLVNYSAGSGIEVDMQGRKVTRE